MIVAIVAVVLVVYLAWHLGHGHGRYRHEKAHGLSPNFMWSSVRGPYGSIRLPGGFRLGHRL